MQRMNTAYRWPENFLHAIAKQIPSEGPFDYALGIKNFETAFEFLITKVFRIPERNINILLASYRDYKTCEEISMMFGISQSRVNQVLHMSLAKFATKRALDVLFSNNVNRCIETNCLYGRKHEELEETTDELIKSIEEAKERIRAAKTAQDAKTAKSAFMLHPVSELQLSNRTHWALATAGIVTIGDVMKYTEEELLTLPRFGYLCSMELRKKLETFGLSIPVSRV